MITILLTLLGVTAAVVPPLHTQNELILDTLYNPVQLSCVNWYGAHMEEYIVNGLDAQPMDSISNTIKNMGFNCVRLMFSTELYFKNPVVTNTSVLAANQALVGMKAMDIFDLTVQSLTEMGLMVVLNNHIGRAMWCCSEEDGEGLWHTEIYPEDMFFEMWEGLSRRYGENSLVVGADLRNELRKAGGVSPSWGTGDPSTDWAAAATTCGNKILSITPTWLIIVEGLNYANDLTDAFQYPIVLDIPGRLVYSAHDYSWQQPEVHNYVSFRNYMDKMWGGLASASASTGTSSSHHRDVVTNETATAAGDVTSGVREAVPMWVGEFGENTDSKWWGWMIHYLRERKFGFSYWAVDGEQRLGQDESFGLLMMDYETVRDEWKLADLQSLQ